MRRLALLGFAGALALTAILYAIFSFGAGATPNNVSPGLILFRPQIAVTTGVDYLVNDSNPALAVHAQVCAHAGREVVPVADWSRTVDNPRWQVGASNSGVYESAERNWRNGLHLVVREGKLYVVGYALRAGSYRAQVNFSCRPTGTTSGGNAFIANTYVVATGADAAVAPQSHFHDHHHNDPPVAHTHDGYAPLAHTHPTTADVGWAHSEYANTCRNLGGFYDTEWTRPSPPRSDPHGHCCIPASAGSGIRTASECQNAQRPQQSRQIPEPAPDAPEGGPPSAPTSP